MSNLTVAVGRDATFQCFLEHLGGYRVSYALLTNLTLIYKKKKDHIKDGTEAATEVLPTNPFAYTLHAHVSCFIF